MAYKWYDNLNIRVNAPVEIYVEWCGLHEDVGGGDKSKGDER